MSVTTQNLGELLIALYAWADRPNSAIKTVKDAIAELSDVPIKSTHEAQHKERERAEAAEKRSQQNLSEVCAVVEKNEALLSQLAIKHHALENLFALVNGECPGLLRDDHHYEMVMNALAAASERQLAEAQNTLSASLFQLEQVRKDAERYRWLVEDHEDRAVRRRRNELAERIPMMSYSAANAAIDAALKEKP